MGLWLGQECSPIRCLAVLHDGRHDCQRDFSGLINSRWGQEHLHFSVRFFLELFGLEKLIHEIF